MSSPRINLREWQTLGPEGNSVLSHRDFGADEATRRLARTLSDSGRIEVLELASGLELRATSFVGRLRLGDLTVTIEPKIQGAPFLHLLRYAYGLRHLDMHASTGYASRRHTFQDLLVLQLASEAEEILRRGVHRDYLRAAADLASPRGRLDFGRLAKTWGRGTTTLPCIHHPRSEDHALNRALQAGLARAASLVVDTELRTRLRHLAQHLGERITTEPLTGHLLAEAEATMDRRTKVYEPALIIAHLLLRSDGVALDESRETMRLPGFLFDMNHFFQRLLSRFLNEHLADHEVEDEYRLKDLFCYDPNHNPKRRRPPVQKPDFLIRRNHQIVAILDAKYRDLWETNLPREMLYQLALYALGRGGADRSAVILYPTLHPDARDQVIMIRDPITGTSHARIVLRPVELLRLETLLGEKTLKAAQQKREMAAAWAFGTTR